VLIQYLSRLEFTLIPRSAVKREHWSLEIQLQRVWLPETSDWLPLADHSV